ncbi:uncharacterized protein LOC129777313 [Toxorhynchites rutilus septentrionalis]|uniref:uncharacterized protein LOC129777313 n=1 Tax=Toxorhynchites rutilus septentrionalis TaxID=329112 RepID=UPI00247B131E|nr:uncharacterized protein LOC129777313 [Toxorhynchites rutilus septentrionalis]
MYRAAVLIRNIRERYVIYKFAIPDKEQDNRGGNFSSSLCNEFHSPACVSTQLLHKLSHLMLKTVRCTPVAQICRGLVAVYHVCWQPLRVPGHSIVPGRVAVAVSRLKITGVHWHDVAEAT